MKPFLPRLVSLIVGRPQPKITLGTRGPFGLFPVSVPLSALENSHMYIVGATGRGKSSFLLSHAHQLITQGQGVTLVDPHGDLVSDLVATLASYPKHRPWLSQPQNRRRIIYFDPTGEYVVPFNPLAAPDTTPYVRAQNVIEAFRRTWSTELKAAPRFASIASHSLLVLIANHLSLAELPKLLTDKPYRESLLENVSDPKVVEFFHHRFDKWGRETPLMIESLLNKATALTLNPYLYPILGASECLGLRSIMDQGKVLLVNLHTPEHETRNLLGSLLMSSFENAALSRTAESASARRKHYLLVDEFQKFTASEGSVATLAEILSECRKFGLNICFAHQSWAQLGNHSRLVGALEQAHMKVCFGTGRDTAEALVDSIFFPKPGEQVKHEVEDEEAQRRSHPLFVSLPEEQEKNVQHIQRLPPRSILVKLPTSDDQVIRLRTVTVPKPRISQATRSRYMTLLAKQYGRPRKALEQEIARRRRQRGNEHKQHAQTKALRDEDLWEEAPDRGQSFDV